MSFLYHKIPEHFVRLTVEYRFWFVHKPVIRVVEFKLLAQFLVDHLPHLVESILILFLH